jgi:hypothetical protein
VLSSYVTAGWLPGCLFYSLVSIAHPAAAAAVRKDTAAAAAATAAAAAPFRQLWELSSAGRAALPVRQSCLCRSAL